MWKSQVKTELFYRHAHDSLKQCYINRNGGLRTGAPDAELWVPVRLPVRPLHKLLGNGLHIFNIWKRNWRNLKEGITILTYCEGNTQWAVVNSQWRDFVSTIKDPAVLTLTSNELNSFKILSYLRLRWDF